MEIKTSELNGVAVLALTGELDMHTSPALRERLMPLVKARRAVVVVDMSSLAYLDSSGIATFVEVLKGMNAYGGSLRMAAVGERIMEVFGFSRLDKVFQIFTSVEDAVGR
jgi:anti-sigma B factor antagonist